MNEITEEDVLRGEKTITVETRLGAMMTVKCRALSWAARIKTLDESNSERMLTSIINGLDKDQANDEFINQFPRQGLVEISNTIILLSDGIPVLKKMAVARNLTAQPATPISTPPPVSCAVTGSMAMK
jgi:hypothetical protein